jgi:hypothetical protein
MKKLFFVFFVVILFSSCYEEYVLLINNDSSYDVSFNLTTGYWTDNYVLEAGKQYSKSLNKNHSYHINDYEPKENVNLSRDGNTYIFNDIPAPEPIQAFIFNTISKEVILSGDGAISTDPLHVKPNEEITTETIIKKEPKFTAETEDGYPVQVDFLLDKKCYKIILR